MNEPTITGTDVLRARVRNCTTRLDYAVIANDLKLTPDRFRDFGQGKVDLPADILQKMAKRFFNAGFDPERDLLVSNVPASTPLGVMPGPFIPDAKCYVHDPNYVPWVQRSETVKKPRGRPGWLNTLFE